jgi:proteasome alpha subunit
MSMPFYVAPEQAMKDKADFARKGIARGRGLVAVAYIGGIAIVAENPSNSLRKVNEIYDRIAFAGVGKFNEFDALRRLGVRYADLQGYQYSRDDVDARSLANEYAVMIGHTFTADPKPLEVEILVAEVSLNGRPDEMFHILYDGTVADENNFTALGGDTDAVTERLRATWIAGLELGAAIKTAVAALTGPDRAVEPGDLEVGILDRNAPRRCFRRLSDSEVSDLLRS